MGRLRLSDEERKVRRRASSKRYADSHLGYCQEWARKNPNKKASGDRDWYLKNKAYVLIKVKEWQNNNPDKVRGYHRKYKKNKSNSDLNFKIAGNLRIRVRKLLGRKTKVGSVIDKLGCSVSELRFYLEGKFKDGMNWENYGVHGWHIDHKIPLSFFDLTDKAQFSQACHYTNLQPMWAIENIKKSNKIYAAS
jgi:hypothetical protein